MNPLRCFVFLLPALILAACQTSEPVKKPAPAPAASLTMRPKVDVRNLRVNLEGKSMKQVVAQLGQPTTAYTLDDREVWSYEDKARDSVTGRDVHLVEIVFKNRLVQGVNFSL